MNKARRIGTFLAAIGAAVAMTSVVATAPASAAHQVKGPQAISQLLGSVDENDSEWVHVWFKTDKKVCNFKLRVWDRPKIDVMHPWNLPFTSLHQNDTLRKNEVDFASFKLTVGDYTQDTWQLLYATMAFNYCGPNAKTQIKHTGFLVRVNVA